MSVLEVYNLTKKFNHLVAVNDITFKVEENEIFGLLGPNGSGKTTTQRMLCTVLSADQGKVKYFNKTLKSENLKDIRYKIGYVPQGECLYGDLTIKENLQFFSTPYNLSADQTCKRINYLLDLLSLTERQNDLVRNLSGGLNKRASIAAALVHRPKILFLDEVTMGLDPNSRYHIWQLIRQLKNTTTIILTTHYMDEAEDLCDRIAILSKGQIIDLDSPKKIISKYKAKDLNEVIAKVIKEEK